MNWKTLLAGLVVGCLSTVVAEAGLFDHHGPSCCAPQPSCAAPAPHCVAQPVCAAPAPYIAPQPVCEPVCAAPAPYVAPHPVCAAPVVDHCCQPKHHCGCERRRGCCLTRLFRCLWDLECRKNRWLARKFLRRGNDCCQPTQHCCQPHYGYRGVRTIGQCPDPMLPYMGAYRVGYSY